jgi:gamma-glutamyltranspeptidase/glutathione hydrolase
MFDKQSLKRIAAPLFALALVACTTGSLPQLVEPERQGGGEAMAVAANPHAVDAAIEILRAGGSATDAAIAAEMVLGLVEPQSSGVGGGGFLVHYDGASEDIIAYDGRERAPAGARPDMFLDENGEPLPFLQAQTSGRATGAPSLVAMLSLAHQDHGRLPWAQLFEPAIRLAENGFEVSPRMARILAGYATR